MGWVPAFAGMTMRLGIWGDGATPRLWRLRAEWIPAYAGMTVRGGVGMDDVGLQGVRSTLSRRVRGILSPYREGDLALARFARKGASFPPTRE